MKRGQVTIYMIIVLVAFLAFGVLYFANADESRKISEQNQFNALFDKQPINAYFDECINSMAEDSLVLFGMQGGNMEIEIKNGTAYLLVRDYYEHGRSTVPAIEELENSYSGYLEQNLHSCADKADFPGYSIEAGKAKVRAKFYNDFVDLNVDYPITAKSKNSVIQLKAFSKKYSVRIGRIYEISKEIVDKFVKNPDEIEYSYFTGLKENFFFIIPYNENVFIILIQDSKSAIRNKKYNFAFGIVFDNSKTDIKEGIGTLLA